MWSYGPAHEEKKKKNPGEIKKCLLTGKSILSRLRGSANEIIFGFLVYTPIPQTQPYPCLFSLYISFRNSHTYFPSILQHFVLFFFVFFFQPVNVTILLLILELNQSFQWRHTWFLATNLLLYWILTTLSPLRTPCSPRIIFRFLDS